MMEELADVGLLLYRIWCLLEAIMVANPTSIEEFTLMLLGNPTSTSVSVPTTKIVRWTLFARNSSTTDGRTMTRAMPIHDRRTHAQQI